MLKLIFGFISVITLNFLMHLYVFLKISFFFNIKKMGSIYILAFFTSIMIIPATIFIRERPNFFTQSFYRLSCALLGIFFLTFISMLFLEMASLSHPLSKQKLGILTLGISFVLIFYSLLNAKNTRIETIKINDFGVKLKLIQISDLHLNSSKPFDKLTKIVKKINSLDPDIVVITGDIVSQDTPIEEKTFAPLKKLHAKTYFITGNHEYYVGNDTVSKLIENSGVKVLRDDVDFFNGLQIVGIEYRFEKEEINTVLSKLEIDKDIPAILLNHVPFDAKDERIKLTISGHTHYGQIVPFNFVVRLTTKYLKGLYKLKTGYLYVSPGTGTWGPPMRLGSKNEITIFDLR